jgi:hypothetical protein
LRVEPEKRLEMAAMHAREVLAEARRAMQEEPGTVRHLWGLITAQEVVGVLAVLDTSGRCHHTVADVPVPDGVAVAGRGRGGRRRPVRSLRGARARDDRSQPPSMPAIGSEHAG